MGKSFRRKEINILKSHEIYFGNNFREKIIAQYLEE